jgi:hypothetical protein
VKIPHIKQEQIAFWDETAKKCELDGAHASQYQHRFPKNEQGHPDPNGTLGPEVKKMVPKFQQRCDMAVGVATVTLPGDPETLVARRLKPVDYTSRWVCSEAVMDGHRMKVVAEARTKGGKAFVTGDRPKRGKGVPLFDDDDVDRIPGVGAVLKRKLADVNITTVGELKAAGEDAPVSPAVRSAAAAAAEGAYLSVAVDHRKADNPYESLHGAAWREHIDKTPAMQKYVSIQTLWTDVMDSTVEGFRGTTHENDFRIYHDALSQLTADATKEWLKTKHHGERSWFDIWITPLEGLNAGTCFFGRPVGNSPELMPLDCSLLADLSHDLSRHVRMTKVLDNIDPKKFSRSTPGRLSRSLRRLLWHSWDDAAEPDFDAATGGSPSARRILQDIAKCMKDHILAIIHAKGAMVDGIGNREGRRERPIGRHGGVRTKLPAPLPRWVHPHAVAAAHAKVQLALQGAGGAGVAAAAVAVDVPAAVMVDEAQTLEELLMDEQSDEEIEERYVPQTEAENVRGDER